MPPPLPPRSRPPRSSPWLDPVPRYRWQTATRWYTATGVRDLLGDWTVVRRWGGRGNRLGGQRIEVVADYPTALLHLTTLDHERRHRPIPYQPVPPCERAGAVPTAP